MRWIVSIKEAIGMRLMELSSPDEDRTPLIMNITIYTSGVGTEPARLFSN